jgi:hypothetical protein
VNTIGNQALSGIAGFKKLLELATGSAITANMMKRRRVSSQPLLSGSVKTAL